MQLNGGLTKSDLEKNPMAHARHPFDERGGWFISLLIVTMSVVGTLTAVVNCDRGASLAASALAGAAVGVGGVAICIWMYGAVWRILWRRTRGYPFEAGDVVEVTSGKNKGRQGRVISHDQGIWHFEVRFDAEAGKTKSHWFSTSQLRRVKATQ